MSERIITSAMISEIERLLQKAGLPTDDRLYQRLAHARSEFGNGNIKQARREANELLSYLAP